MSRRPRPWHKNQGFGKKAKVAAPPTVPFVEVDGHHYLSDRFYLNTSVHDARPLEKATCSCGAAHPPPLWDRARLVASLDLKAAILATYSMEPAWLAEEFPSLLGAGATIPTLVLHGKKGYGQPKKSTEESQSSAESPLKESPLPPLAPTLYSSKVATSSATDAVDDEEDDTNTLCTQPEHIGDWEPVSTPEPTRTIKSLPLSSLAHFTEVLSTWLPPHLFPDHIVNDDGHVSDEVRQQRVYRKGVHHAKYMILWERSGSVVVVVSTANLVRPASTDATWVQRFAPRGTSISAVPASKMDGSDGGAVLVDFLQQQTLAAREGQLTPLGFVRRYLGLSSLSELDRRYDFSTCSVHLVAVVPGDHDGRHCTRHVQPDFLYGRQRVEAVVDGLSRPSRDMCLPPSAFSDKDRLIIQPTSFGGDWNTRNMSDVVQSYWGGDETDDKDALLERLDIVWPTEDFMREVRCTLDDRRSPNAVVASATMGFAVAAEDNDKDVMDAKEMEGYLFLSSETFNRIDSSCLSRMVLFEPSMPEQRPTLLTPHFKSVARVFRGSDYRLRKDYACGRAEETFSWFLLTSACLSRGAQGERLANPAPGSDAVSYANFELGVLFCSRLQGNRQTDRLYCWKPAQCFCRDTTAGGDRLIHLPVPYSFKPARYQEDDDELDFCETPYFHEIPPGTGAVGNMRITPYGAALAAKYKSR